LARIARYIEGEGGIPPYEYYVAKLCRAYQCLPWDIDPTIIKGDMHWMLLVLDILSYEDAWKQFIDDPQNFGDMDKADMIESIRELKKELWPAKK